MKPDKLLWRKYLEGKASPEELTELEAWLQSTGVSDEQWAEWVREDAPVYDPMPSDMTQRLREHLLSTARQEEQPAPLPLPGPKKSFSWQMAAAAIVLLVVSGLYLFRQHPIPAAAIDSLAWDSVINNSAVAKQITLPDQTKIWLNQHAVLYVNKEYTAKRLVRLIGEGYFEVARDEQHPFVAMTGNVQTLVLGTAFNIDNTPGHASVSISLVRGSVSVRRAKGEGAVLLSPAETAIADNRGGTIVRSNTGVPDIAGWINDDLVFNQLPLSEALIKFGVYYGITLHADSGLLANKTATAVYHRRESWQQALHHLLFIYQLNYKTDGYNNIFISRP